MKIFNVEEQIKIHSKIKLIKNKYYSIAAFEYNEEKYYIYKSYYYLTKYELCQEPPKTQISFFANNVNEMIEKLDNIFLQEMNKPSI
jgi:hypothetical protein